MIGVAGPDDSALEPGWVAYDPSQVWTLTSIGSLCSDRGAAYQAVTLGKGWDWVFGGGTAKYAGKPFINPNPPPGIDAQLVVTPIETGNDGAHRRASRSGPTSPSPITSARSSRPANGRRTSTGRRASPSPRTSCSRWQDLLGIDVVFLAADHQSDRGNAGIQSTIEILDKHGVPHTGLGMDLDRRSRPRTSR